MIRFTNRNNKKRTRRSQKPSTYTNHKHTVFNSEYGQVDTEYDQLDIIDENEMVKHKTSPVSIDHEAVLVDADMTIASNVRKVSKARQSDLNQDIMSESFVHEDVDRLDRLDHVNQADVDLNQTDVDVNQADIDPKQVDISTNLDATHLDQSEINQSEINQSEINQSEIQSHQSDVNLNHHDRSVLQHDTLPHTDTDGMPSHHVHTSHLTSHHNDHDDFEPSYKPLFKSNPSINFSFEPIEYNHPVLLAEDFQNTERSPDIFLRLKLHHAIPELSMEQSSGFGQMSYQAYYRKVEQGTSLQKIFMQRSDKEKLEFFQHLSELFYQLEKQKQPPLALMPNQIYVDDHEISILVGPRGISWCDSLVKLMIHCYVLNQGIDTQDWTKQHHWIASLELLTRDQLLPASIITLMRMALIQSNVSMKSWHHDLLYVLRFIEGQQQACDDSYNNQRPKKTNKSNQSNHAVKNRIKNMSIGFDQRVGRRKIISDKYSSKATHLQQEDRVWAGAFEFKQSRYWLAVVMDGVSTCSYGSGAEVAQQCQQFVIDNISQLNQKKNLLDYLTENPDVNQSEIILTWLYEGMKNHLNHCMQKYEREIMEGHSTMDGLTHEIHHPSCTVSFVLIDEHGLASIAWVGDSPVLLYKHKHQQLDLINYAHKYALEFIAAEGYGHSLIEAFEHESAQQLTRHVSGSESSDLEFRQFSLQKHDVLILCSDGLIDGFINEQTHNWSRPDDALIRLQTYMQEIYTRHSVSAHVAEDLVTEANRNRGVDNISAVVLKFDQVIR